MPSDFAVLNMFICYASLFYCAQINGQQDLMHLQCWCLVEGYLCLTLMLDEEGEALSNK